MTTLIRAELSSKNKYWISKHRHYELKHFCLQYPNWKKEYEYYSNISPSVSKFGAMYTDGVRSDPTADKAIKRAYYSERIDLIEKTAKEADKYLYEYILKAVTEGLSYTYLKTIFQIPCGKDLYYDRYRKFFWLLNKLRN